MAKDVGVPLAKGSRVDHAGALQPARPDRAPTSSAAQLRLAPATAKLAPLETMLLPAPVELPCRPGHDQRRSATAPTAVADVQERFGGDVGQTANYLHLLCGQGRAGTGADLRPRRCSQPATIRAAAGHMHLLGRSIKIEVDPGTPQARTVLDIPVWDFDNQGAKPVRADRAEAGRHRAGHLPARPVAARPAAGVQGPAGEVRRVGRGHHRRDVPRHAAGHAPLTGSGQLPPRLGHQPGRDRHAA